MPPPDQQIDEIDAILAKVAEGRESWIASVPEIGATISRILSQVVSDSVEPTNAKRRPAHQIKKAIMEMRLHLTKEEIETPSPELAGLLDEYREAAWREGLEKLYLEILLGVASLTHTDVILP